MQLSEEDEKKTLERRGGSQAEFRHTPYMPSQWPVVGQKVDDKNFQPLEVEILQASGGSDFMFESFDKGSLWIEREAGAHVSEQEAKRLDQKAEEPLISEDVIRRERMKAFEEGKTAGYKEGFDKAQQEIASKYEHLSQQARNIGGGVQAQLEVFFEQVEKQALKMSLDIAKRILVTTADIKPEYIVDVIREGFKSLGAAQVLRLRVNPRDMEFLEVVGLPPDMYAKEHGIEFVIDESIEAGCVLETDFGDVDLQIDRMWREIKDKLYEVCK